MKSTLYWLALGAMIAGAGCHRDATAETRTEGGQSREHTNAEPSGGVSYTPGRGLMVREEIRKQLGWEAVPVALRTLDHRVEFLAQVISPDASSGRWQASGTVPRAELTEVTVGHEVVLRGDAGATFAGHVRALDESLSQLHGDVEVVVELDGSLPSSVRFLRATIPLTIAREALVVPNSAVLRTVEGTFVYVLNGDVSRRTAVRLGATMEGVTEITEGLRRGEAVVAGSVEALYLVELRAMKGADHDH